MILNKCKHCGKKTKTEKFMILHLEEEHDIHLPPVLSPEMFDGGLDKIKRELRLAEPFQDDEKCN